MKTRNSKYIIKYFLGALMDYDNNMEKRLSIHERVATVEAANRYTKQALQDISLSLKEVVKTQHILASQKEELTKLVKVVSDIQSNLSIINETNIQQNFHIDNLRRDNEEVKEELERVSDIVEKNKTHLNLMIKIGSAILLPLIAAVVKQYFGF